LSWCNFGTEKLIQVILKVLVNYCREGGKTEGIENIQQLFSRLTAFPAKKLFELNSI